MAAGRGSKLTSRIQLAAGVMINLIGLSFLLGGEWSLRGL